MAITAGGKFTEFSVTQLLNLIDLAHKTGLLHINRPATDELFGKNGSRKHRKEAGDRWATLAFVEGRLALASLNGQHTNLLDVLAESGRLTYSQVQALRCRCAEYPSEKGLALFLIHGGYVTQTDVVLSVQRHTLDILYEVLAWQPEIVNFVEEMLPPDDCIVASINLKEVILEGIRRTQEVRAIEADLPDLDMVVKFSAASERLKGLPLSVQEWNLISFIDSRTSIRDLGKACNMTETEILLAVSKLLKAKLVTLEPSKSWGLPTAGAARRVLGGRVTPS